MDELQKFIVNKGLEKASLGIIEQAIKEDPSLSQDKKEFWLGALKGYSTVKDVCDILNFLNRRR